MNGKHYESSCFESVIYKIYSERDKHMQEMAQRGAFTSVPLLINFIALYFFVTLPEAGFLIQPELLIFVIQSLKSG